MKPRTTARTSDGGHSYEGTEGKLYQTITKASTEYARLWLFKNLMKNGLATRDIYYFAAKQADLRIENKNMDHMTVRHAMQAKIRDVYAAISQLNKQRKKLELDHRSNIKVKNLSVTYL